MATMTAGTHATDPDGYVLMAYFRGPARKIRAVAELLGLADPRGTQPLRSPATLVITPRDRITPDQLEAATELWTRS